MNKLRSPLGKALDTFTAVENVLKAYAFELRQKYDEEEKSRGLGDGGKTAALGKSAPSSSGRNMTTKKRVADLEMGGKSAANLSEVDISSGY